MNEKRALFCTPTMPELDRESGSRRLYNLLEYLLHDGWAVTLMVREPEGGDRARRELHQLGVPVYRGYDDRVTDAIANSWFDLAVVAFWYIAEELVPLIRSLSPETRIVLDSVDLHFLRRSRQHAGSAGKGMRGRLDGATGEEFYREINAYLTADRVLTVSRKEADLVDDLTGVAGLAVAVPDAESLDRSPFGFAERSGTLFLGNFRHPPNPEALEWLCTDILPLVDPDLLRANPLQVVGNALDLRYSAMIRSIPGGKAIGWVPEVTPYISRARVMVAPLRHGAGTKRKILQALMCGTPTVTTTIGAEGLPVRDGEGLLVRDDAAGFAAAVEQVLTDRALWERLAETGHARISAVHSEAAVRAGFIEEIAA
ncbi:MAG: glycosyltransferase family 4 protein, partial [Thermomicrobiales bacterium]